MYRDEQISPSFVWTKAPYRLEVPGSAIEPPAVCPPEHWRNDQDQCVLAPGASVLGPIIGGMAGLSGLGADNSRPSTLTIWLMAMAVNSGAGYLVAKATGSNVAITTIASGLFGILGMAGGVYATRKGG